MKAYALGCACYDGTEPLIRYDDEGNQAVEIYSTYELAAMKATEMEHEDGQHPKVLKIEITTVSKQ